LLLDGRGGVGIIEAQDRSAFGRSRDRRPWRGRLSLKFSGTEQVQEADAYQQTAQAPEKRLADHAHPSQVAS
jgi:hypothetical protein